MFLRNQNVFYVQWATSFNQRIDDWDISSVADMRSMFKEQHLSIYQFETGMFLMSTLWKICSTELVHLINQLNWSVSNVTNMKSLFLDAAAFNQPIEDWNISSVTEMEKILMEPSLSLANRKNIHESFSFNPNWTYDWGTLTGHSAG